MRLGTAILLLFLFSCSDGKDNSAKSELRKDSLQAKNNNVVHPPDTVNYSFVPNKKATPYRGEIVECAEWKDKRGENILILSVTPQHYDWMKDSPEMKKFAKNPDDVTLQDLFAYHYIFDSTLNKWKQIRNLHDFRFHCCDISFHYVPGTFKIEDIDNDGDMESSFMYHIIYQSDRYYNSKLILYVDTVKLKVEGTCGLEKPWLGKEDPPEKYVGLLFKKDSAYYRWANTRWVQGCRRQFIEDSLWGLKWDSAMKANGGY